MTSATVRFIAMSCGSAAWLVLVHGIIAGFMRFGEPTGGAFLDVKVRLRIGDDEDIIQSV